MDFLAQLFIRNSHPIGQTLGMAGLLNDLAISSWIMTPEPFFADHPTCPLHEPKALHKSKKPGNSELYFDDHTLGNVLFKSLKTYSISNRIFMDGIF
jgi:hypothetical protein